MATTFSITTGDNTTQFCLQKGFLTKGSVYRSTSRNYKVRAGVTTWANSQSLRETEAKGYGWQEGSKGKSIGCVQSHLSSVAKTHAQKLEAVAHVCNPSFLR